MDKESEIWLLKRNAKPRWKKYDISYGDMGHVNYNNNIPARGWYDVQNQGVPNDYCRYVGDEPNIYWSCVLAGDNETIRENEYKETDKNLPVFNLENYIQEEIIELELPFYKKWWFTGIFVTVCLLIILAIIVYYYKKNKINKK
jgi:hypothetical protein